MPERFFCFALWRQPKKKQNKTNPLAPRVGLHVYTTHFNVNFPSRIACHLLNSSSCASIILQGVMPPIRVSQIFDFQCAHTLLHYTTLSFRSSITLTSPTTSVIMHAANVWKHSMVNHAAHSPIHQLYVLGTLRYENGKART